MNERNSERSVLSLHRAKPERKAAIRARMYEDYAISPELFHWQSQSTTSADSPTGKRYIEHRKQGYTPLLFVRERKKLPSGLAAPYAFLGPAEYVSHQGSRPISIVWKLQHPIPPRVLRPLARQSVG